MVNGEGRDTRTRWICTENKRVFSVHIHPTIRKDYPATVNRYPLIDHFHILHIQFPGIHRGFGEGDGGLCEEYDVAEGDTDVVPALV